MTEKESEYVAQIFSQQMSGVALTLANRVFLKRILDGMNEPERAGAVGAIIRIMLGE